MLDRCPECTGKCRPVCGDGPEPADVMFIGDRPGPEANKRGRPVCGKGGKELDENYLNRAGLHREDVRVTEIVKCFAEGNRKTSDKEIKSCGEFHIPDELARCAPRILVLMGASACSLVPDLDLDIDHGIPRIAEVLGWRGTVVPMYNPNAGVHDTGKMIPLLEDFERLREVVKGTWKPPVNPYPNPTYSLINDWASYDRFMESTVDANVTHKLLAIDTERHGSDAFSIQVSCAPGTGYMMLWSQHVIDRVTGGKGTIWEAMRAWIYRVQAHYEWEIVLHNAPQDLDWLDRMGIRVKRFRDTMQESYHLGNLPQGLKGLAYRLLGIRMRTYGDVVMPHSRDAITEWMLTALDHAETVLTKPEYKQLKTKVKLIVKPSETERMLRRVIRYTLESPKYDPWEKLAEFAVKSKEERVIAALIGNTDIADWRSVESTCGPAPIVGIGNVPIDEAVRYGCADADMTLRVALKLAELRDRATGNTGKVLRAMGQDGTLCIADGDEDMGVGMEA